MIEFVKRINEDKPFYEQGVAKDIFSWKELENLLNLRPVGKINEVKLDCEDNLFFEYL